MIRKILLFTFILILTKSWNSIGQTKRIPGEKPKLIVGIVVSQMRYDYITRFWDKLEEGGIKKLVERGVFCKNTRFNYIFSHKGVGHASIGTGTTPSNHGIVAESWYMNLQDEVTGNVEDKKQKTVGGSYETGKYSPKHLMSTTFADEIRLASNFNSKVISVGLEPSQTILLAGHSANATYWFDYDKGNFITSSYYIDTLPKWAKEFNEKKIPEIYINKIWEPLLPIESYTESLPDKNKYETGFDKQITFPYNLAEMAIIKKKKYDYKILLSTPFGNNLAKDFAISALINEGLGKDDITDVLFISFTATEEIGNLFGPSSIEVQDAFIRLDREISHFLKLIDEEIGKENTLIIFTSDHGVSLAPSYLEDSKIPAGYFNYNGAISLLGSALKNIYGRGDWIKSYHSQQIYLNRILIEDSKIPLNEFQNYCSNFMLQFEGVANSLSASILQTTNFTSGIFQKIQNSYNQKNSGDIIINLKPGWVEQSDGTTYHNSSYSYDARIPLIFYGWKVGRKTIWRPVDIVDIAPTISTFLDIPYPNACTGEPIIEMVE